MFDRFSVHQLEVVGRGGLIQARVLKLKKAVKGDANAREVSDALPFLGMVISNPPFQFILFYFIFSNYTVCRGSVGRSAMLRIRDVYPGSRAKEIPDPRIHIRIKEFNYF